MGQSQYLATRVPLKKNILKNKKLCRTITISVADGFEVETQTRNRDERERERAHMRTEK